MSDSQYKSRYSFVTLAVALLTLSTRIDASAIADELGHGYSRKKDSIFCAGNRFDQEGKKEVDRFSWAVGHELALHSEMDAYNFLVVTEEYTKDKNRVYYKWMSPGRFWVVELPGADPQSFKMIDKLTGRGDKAL